MPVGGAGRFQSGTFDAKRCFLGLMSSDPVPRTRDGRCDEESVRLPRQPRGEARPGYIPIRLVMLMRLLSSVS